MNFVACGKVMFVGYPQLYFSHLICDVYLQTNGANLSGSSVTLLMKYAYKQARLTTIVVQSPYL